MLDNLSNGAQWGISDQVLSVVTDNVTTGKGNNDVLLTAHVLLTMLPKFLDSDIVLCGSCFTQR